MEISILGVRKKITQFPQHWDNAMRKAKVEESLQNLIAQPKPIANKPNKFEVVGKTSEGILIQTRINLKSKKIMTAFVDGDKMRTLHGKMHE